MQVLVIGSGGREHALVWRLAKSASVKKVYASPGNAGIAKEADCLPCGAGTPADYLALAEALGVDALCADVPADLTSVVVGAGAAGGEILEMSSLLS